jgi:hypothetical protein
VKGEEWMTTFDLITCVLQLAPLLLQLLRQHVHLSSARPTPSHLLAEGRERLLQRLSPVFLLPYLPLQLPDVSWHKIEEIY